MKIRVCYSELVSLPGYCHRSAEAELEVTVEGVDLDKAYQRAWERVKSEVKRQLTETGEELPF